MDRYGAGYLDEYIWLLEPDRPDPQCDLLDTITSETDDLDLIWSNPGDPPPPQLAATGGRLIPWARTDNGEVFYWLAQFDLSPDNWTVMLRGARGPLWEHYEMGCGTLLLQSLSGTIRSELFWFRFPLRISKHE